MTASLSRITLIWLLSASVAVAQMPHETSTNTAQTSAEDADSDDTPPPVIQETALSRPSLESVGLIDASNGGLSNDVWKNGSRTTAENLLLALRSGGIADETIRSLTLRLLMTQAAPPPGNGTRDWFLLRLETLLLLGQDDKAEAMIASIPASLQNDTLRSLHAQLWLIRGETDKACQLAANVPKEEGASDESLMFWQKLTITCQAVKGNMNEALVGIDLLRETYHTDDLFFLDAIHTIGDKKSTLRSLPKKWTLFDVTLVRLAGQTEKLKDKVDMLPALAIKYLAQDATIDPKLREKALIKAEGWGLVPATAAPPSQEPPFTSSIASDVTSLVRALASTSTPNEADNRIIARLAIDESIIQDTRRVSRLLSLMEPLGYTIPQSTWEKLWPHRFRSDAELPSASLLTRLEDAAQAKRTGEVIVLSALISGNTTADRASELTLVPIIRALIATGFTAEARQLAAHAVKNYSVH